MNALELMRFCYERYRHEEAQADAICRRAGVFLAVLALIGAAAFALRNPAGLLGELVALGGVAVGLFFLFGALLPRQYESLAPMKKWTEWRDLYRSLFEVKAPNEEAIASLFVAMLTQRITEAESDHGAQNEARRRQLGFAIRSAAVAACGLAVEAAFSFWLQLRG